MPPLHLRKLDAFSQMLGTTNALPVLIGRRNKYVCTIHLKQLYSLLIHSCVLVGSSWLIIRSNSLKPLNEVLYTAEKNHNEWGFPIGESTKKIKSRHLQAWMTHCVMQSVAAGFEPIIMWFLVEMYRVSKQNMHWICNIGPNRPNRGWFHFQLNFQLTGLVVFE